MKLNVIFAGIDLLIFISAVSLVNELKSAIFLVILSLVVLVKDIVVIISKK